MKNISQEHPYCFFKVRSHFETSHLKRSFASQIVPGLNVAIGVSGAKFFKTNPHKQRSRKRIFGRRTRADIRNIPSCAVNRNSQTSHDIGPKQRLGMTVSGHFSTAWLFHVSLVAPLLTVLKHECQGKYKKEKHQEMTGVCRTFRTSTETTPLERKTFSSFGTFSGTDVLEFCNDTFFHLSCVLSEN